IPSTLHGHDAILHDRSAANRHSSVPHGPFLDQRRHAYLQITTDGTEAVPQHLEKALQATNGSPISRSMVVIDHVLDAGRPEEQIEEAREPTIREVDSMDVPSAHEAQRAGPVCEGRPWKWKNNGLDSCRMDRRRHGTGVRVYEHRPKAGAAGYLSKLDPEVLHEPPGKTHIRPVVRYEQNCPPLPTAGPRHPLTRGVSQGHGRRSM